MKFSTATISLLALLAQQVAAIALPLSDQMSAELEARHQHDGHRRGGFGGFGNKGGAGNRNGGGNTGGNKNAGGKSSSAAPPATTTATTGNKGTGTAVGAGAVGAGAAVAAGGGKGKETTTSSAVIGSSTSVAAVAASTTTTSFAPGSTGSNSGLSAAQITALQTSLTLDPTQIQPALADDGQDVQEAGQVASLTSTNNFMNFCATQSGVPLTNGLQIKTGSCNPTIMGRIIAANLIPTAKFTFPANMGTVARNTTFTITMAINNMVTGSFTNAAETYYSAPCQVDSTGKVIGHSHFVVEPLTSFTQTTVTNPLSFAFFKGVNTAAVNGILSAEVTGGLNPGFYRLGSITSCSNHQTVLPSIAQRGLVDDAIYFQVK